MKLALEDGTVLSGESFGGLTAVAGEVVFNTAMSGYVETLTDPSYCGQILTLTYPLVGNYGVPAPASDDLLKHSYESDRIQVQGLVVQNYVDHYSHHSADRSLAAWLKADHIPAISGVDTRLLTRKLRQHGTMAGWLFPDDMDLAEAKSSARKVDMDAQVFQQVAPARVQSYGGGNVSILLIDVGAKHSIVRSLLARGASVTRAPWHRELAPLAEQADGILIGNGPGDPKHLTGLVKQLTSLLESYKKPILGICLGHQLLNLAAGGNTFKLPYGHRGVNQPVQDLVTRRCLITSQNHGYAVDEKDIPADWEPWFVNVNDGTNEGLRHRYLPYSSVQFHPEAKPGPTDAAYLFDEFLRQVRSMVRR